jgi:hypothetical protein
MNHKVLEAICIPILVGTVIFGFVNGIVHCCHVGGFWGVVGIVLGSLSVLALAALFGADAVS